MTPSSTTARSYSQSAMAARLPKPPKMLDNSVG